MNIGEAKDNLSGLLHGADVDDLEDPYLVFERAANTLRTKLSPLEVMRTVALANTIHDDFYTYTLPSDFGEIIDLYPQADRDSHDVATRQSAQRFDLRKLIEDKKISIEGSEGSKVLKVVWRGRPSKVLNTMDSKTSNGTWAASGSASGVVADSIFKVSGSASIKFNLTATGGGIANSDMAEVDLTDEDEVGDFFVPVYLSAAPTSISARWGNDLSSNYWTSVAQTEQADGTAFKVGWNLLKFPWATATETGTVDPATIDSFRLTIAGDAQNSVRVDNIVCSIGRNFDIKYYSKFLFRTEAGVWISKPTSDTDIINLDNDAIQIFLLECLIVAAHEIESSNDSGDIAFAQGELNGHANSPDRLQRIGLYRKYEKNHPKQTIKEQRSYGPRRPSRGRW
jgi:hypothetical protein